MYITNIWIGAVPFGVYAVVQVGYPLITMEPTVLIIAELQHTHPDTAAHILLSIFSELRTDSSIHPVFSSPRFTIISNTSDIERSKWPARKAASLSVALGVAFAGVEILLILTLRVHQSFMNGKDEANT